MDQTRRQYCDIVVLSPLYGLFNTVGRFVAFPFWVKNRFDFVFRKKLSRRVNKRWLLAEYAAITAAIISLLAYSIYRFPISIFNSRY